MGQHDHLFGTFQHQLHLAVKYLAEYNASWETEDNKEIAK